MYFTRKHKVLPFTPPSLARKRLERKNSAKYLGVILDINKLDCNEYLDKKIRKFHPAFCMAMLAMQRLFGRRDSNLNL